MNKSINKKVIWQIVVVTFVIYLLEMISYFYIAEYFGSLFGIQNTVNLQLPVDRLTPWFTPLFAVYIPWPFMWFIVIPLVIYFAGGRERYYEYVVNGFFMYIIGSIIYMLVPSTTTPHDFIDGKITTLARDNVFFYPIVNGKLDTSSPIEGIAKVIQTNLPMLDKNAMFRSLISRLAESGDNIWGSFPSYHNYWAALFIFFALKKGVKIYFRIPMIIIGILISLSTLMLHQHCLMDVVITYSMTGAFMYIILKYNLHTRFEAFLNRIFKVRQEADTPRAPKL